MYFLVTGKQDNSIIIMDVKDFNEVDEIMQDKYSSIENYTVHKMCDIQKMCKKDLKDKSLKHKCITILD